MVLEVGSSKIADIFFALESSSIARVINESDWGYVIAISAHAVGMGVFVGVVLLGNLWCLGCFSALTSQTIRKLYFFAWPALLLNSASGFCMFSVQASLFIVQLSFLIKIAALFIVVLLSLYMYYFVLKSSVNKQSNIMFSKRALSAFSILLLLTVIVSGRLIAYTGDFA